MKNCFLFLLATSITFFSCQPGIDDIDPPQPEENDSIYISQVLELDTTYAPGIDTSQNTIYKYDASGRLSHVWFGEYMRGAVGAELTDDYYFFYNGTDTLPQKIVHLSGSKSSSTVLTLFKYDTAYIFYNNAGVIVRDSTVSADEDRVHTRTTVSTFTRITDGHYRTDKKMISANDVTTSYTNSHFVRSGGNLISSRDTAITEDGDTDMIIIADATYDDHPNPLLRTSLPYPTSSSGGILGESSRNNQIRWNGVYDYVAFKREYLEMYEFKYRADGYPTIRFTKDQLEPDIVRYYTYTKR